MSSRFTSFVVFAEMRTGSNFLESNLNALDGVACLGEVFNPHFIGYPKSDNVLGVSLDDRLADPLPLLEKIKQTPDQISGFRFFHDHDPRVINPILDDDSCAKIILTRNPADSYVSWKIAQATNQWKLTNPTRRKEALAHFDPVEFENHLGDLQAFQIRLLNRLQTSGQTAFYIAYEDLHDLDVINGLAKWLGIAARLDALDDALKRQNPEPMSDKVDNFDQMDASMARLDRFNLHRTPNFEPRRGPVIPTYIACAKSPLLFQPVAGGPNSAVADWMAALDDVETDDLLNSFDQKSLRQWKRQHGGHRSFSVLRHPLARAHAAFSTKLLLTGPTCFTGIRKFLKRSQNLTLPNQLDLADLGPSGSFDKDAYRAAFSGFLRFVKMNLQGKTAMRVDPLWASQSNCVQGLADFSHPDHLLREDNLAQALPALAQSLGLDTPPIWQDTQPPLPFDLADIYDGDLENLARSAYSRDYMMFGFSDWTPT